MFARFLVLFSAIGTILYKTKFGQVGYNAGNEFFDAFAQSRMFGEGIVRRRHQLERLGRSGHVCGGGEARAKTIGRPCDPSEQEYSMSVAEAIEAF